MMNYWKPYENLRKKNSWSSLAMHNKTSSNIVTTIGFLPIILFQTPCAEVTNASFNLGSVCYIFLLYLTTIHLDWITLHCNSSC